MPGSRPGDRLPRHAPERDRRTLERLGLYPRAADCHPHPTRCEAPNETLAIPKAEERGSPRHRGNYCAGLLDRRHRTGGCRNSDNNPLSRGHRGHCYSQVSRRPRLGRIPYGSPLSLPETAPILRSPRTLQKRRHSRSTRGPRHPANEPVGR